MKGTTIGASELTERITLLKPGQSTDSFNNVTETFTAVATVWARIEEGGGREFYAAETLNPEKRIRAKIRYREDIDRDWRFRYGGRDYDIQDIAKIRRRKGLILSGTSHDPA